MSAPATKTEELDALLGTTLAERYRMDELLGIGGMGAVFRARHLLLKRDVAVKVLHASLAANEDISKRFDREAQSAARLDHPNIIPVTEFGSTDDGMKYMVMQLLSGQELGELMTGPLEPLRAIDLVIQILRGLEHAHDNGVIHRDLKPENVFVTTDHDDEEILKLVDFGIAKIIDEDDEEASQPLTRMGLVFGTPHYMSPEQATGSAIDHRTDIYSAGVMLYQMLAGQLPFDHDDPVSLIRMQVTVDPPPLPERVPEPLKRVVRMMMAKEKGRRYPDARSARKALQAIQGRLAEEAGVPVKFSPHDTGVVDPRDIYPPGHEAIANNPAFASSDSGRHWDPSEVSGSDVGSAPTHPTPTPASASSSGEASAGTSGPKVTHMSLADALAHPGAQQRSPFAEALARVPRKWWYVGGGVLGLLVVLAAWPSGEDDEGAGGESGGVVAKPGDDEAEPVVSSVDEETLVAIDKALTSKNEDEALDLIRPARDKHPEDPQLLWREGKALSLKRAKSHDVTALERYGEALDHDPSLVENPDFYGELYVLLNQKNLREQAIDLSLQKLGPAGHKFLLGLVNVDDPKQILEWTDRHRILDSLRGDLEAMKLVDWKLNLARDLYQVDQTDKPCVEFSRVLDQISESGDAYYLEHLFSKLDPPAFKEGSDDDPSICEALPGKIVVIRDLIAVAHPDEAEKYRAQPSKKKKKRKKK